MPLTDDDLMRRFLAGDNCALERILGRHHRDIHWLLRVAVGSDAIARKLLVELYAAVYLTWFRPSRRFDSARGPLKGYLVALAGNLAYRWLMGGLELGPDDGE